MWVWALPYSLRTIPLPEATVPTVAPNAPKFESVEDVQNAA